MNENFQNRKIGAYIAFDNENLKFGDIYSTYFSSQKL